MMGDPGLSSLSNKEIDSLLTLLTLSALGPESREETKVNDRLERKLFRELTSREGSDSD